MTPTILFRKTYNEQEEFDAACKHMRVVESRCECRDALVIGRYSVLPFYHELERDLKHHGSRLINSYEEHRWIADFQYYDVLKDYTFETWDERSFPFSKYPGPFVVKGRTNSKKHQWGSHMYAQDRTAAIEVASLLYQDPLIGQQGLLYRKYEPLVCFERGLNELPFTNEWRCFFLGDTLLAHGYYWSEADVVDRVIAPEGLEFVRQVASLVKDHVSFFVLDIAEKESGGWILVEVNDAQMSGLSMIEPDVLYSNLARACGA